MLRSKSRSPCFRKYPWEEPDFDPHKVLAELDRTPQERSHHFRKGSKELENMYPEGQRRSFPDDYQFRRQHHPDQDEVYHRMSSPHHDGMHYKNQRFSTLDDGRFDMERDRRGFREPSQKFEKRGALSQSPPRMAREGFSSSQRSHSDHQQRGMGPSWRREEQDRGQGRFRDFNPDLKSGDNRAGDWERGRRNLQGFNRGRQRENPHHDRGPPFKRPRRELDSADHPGYRNEEDFGGKGFSMDAPRGGFKGGTRGNFSQGGNRHSGPLGDHHRGFGDSREPSQWEPCENRRRHYSEFDRHMSPRPPGSPQESFRPSDSRLDNLEDRPDYPFQDDLGDPKYHGTRRSPVPKNRPNTTIYGNKNSPMNHRGRGGVRRRYDQGQGGRIEHPLNQPHLQQSSQGYQDLPSEEQRPEYRPLREDFGESFEEEPNWEEKGKPQQWKQDRSGSLDRNSQKDDLNPKVSRQKEHRWNDQKSDSMNVVTEETLTIKVDMSRPAKQNSLLFYSSDRQLSLDLVNVGRQRLDFLPMLEHSGTYQETAMHTGTFAQEIITLVHLVKEQYFRGDGVTLNERFSAPQGYSEGEPEEMTLSQRFSSNRGFSLNIESLFDEDDDEPAFARMGPMQGLRKQPLRGPGDLRHDLERRRQEKLEGVQVTIPGNSLPHSSMEPVNEPDPMSPMDHEGFSNWSRDQSRRREGNFGPRGGPSNRLNMDPQRRNNRRHHMHGSPADSSW